MMKIKRTEKTPAILALRGSGYTQAMVAERVGCQPFAVTMVLQGKYKKRVSRKVADKIMGIVAKLTNKTREELFGKDGGK